MISFVFLIVEKDWKEIYNGNKQKTKIKTKIVKSIQQRKENKRKENRNKKNIVSICAHVTTNVDVSFILQFLIASCSNSSPLMLIIIFLSTILLLFYPSFFFLYYQCILLIEYFFLFQFFFWFCIFYSIDFCYLFNQLK